MNKSMIVSRAHRRALTRLRMGLGRGCALMTAGLLLLLAAGGWSVAPAQAASSSALTEATFTAHRAAVSGTRASEQYVFSMGIVDQMSADTLTLDFGDGVTETYTLNGTTTIQTQNGDALGLTDLDIGDMVIVLTVENESLARTIVSGGEAGFHAAGPGDIRGHDERACEACDAYAP